MLCRRTLVVTAGAAIMALGACSTHSSAPTSTRAHPTTSPATRPTTSVNQGGDGGSAESTFVQTANRVCAEAHLKLDGVPAPSDEQSIATYLNEAYDIIDGLGRELSNLEPPPGGAIALRDSLAALASEAKALADARRAHDAGDGPGRDEQLRQAAHHQTEFGRQTEAIGLDSCAKFAS